MTQDIVAGTRRSTLAMAQTQLVVAQLRQLHADLGIRVTPIVTEGDRNSGPLQQTGKGAFTGALEAALEKGSIDFAVHSLKDLPVELPAQLTLGAVLNRVSARDVLVTPGGCSLRDLAYGSRIGTSSQRRTAQLKAFRTDLRVVPIRGNVDTRIRKMKRGVVEALVLAEAGLIRLGLMDQPHHPIDCDIMVPAPGQGALAVECRQNDDKILQVIEHLDCQKARHETKAERAFLKALGGGCTLPVGAMAEWNGQMLTMRAAVYSRDGSKAVQVQGQGNRARLLGKSLAEQARSLGAMDLLANG